MLIIPTEKRFDWKHTPVILFFVVLANVLIFFLYQSGDQAKLQSALDDYYTHNYFEIEWPLYKKYLSNNGQDELLVEHQNLYDEGLYDQLSLYILIRSDFYTHLQESRQQYFGPSGAAEWSEVRNSIKEKIQATSLFGHGLNPSDPKPLSFITYQFLHGGVMHLLSNMFFLIICGFAVEAAVGHLAFLLFYIIAGIAGALLHTVFNLEESLPMVGASGSISGVMAMYLGIFKFKKIEFFYWFFIFVGYFRAPALLILPFYIGKELFQFYSDTGSNVAFMAHSGGFIAGALLIIISLIINSKMLNEEYIEENQAVDDYQNKLATVYKHIEKYNFNHALQALAELINEYGLNFKLALLRYNLMKIEKGEAYQQCVIDLLNTKKPSPVEIETMEKVWIENPEASKKLDDDSITKLGLTFSSLENLKSAEKICNILLERGQKTQSLGVLARKLSISFERSNNLEKKQKYEKIAEDLMGATR